MGPSAEAAATSGTCRITVSVRCSSVTSTSFSSDTLPPLPQNRPSPLHPLHILSLALLQAFPFSIALPRLKEECRTQSPSESSKRQPVHLSSQNLDHAATDYRLDRYLVVPERLPLPSSFPIPHGTITGLLFLSLGSTHQSHGC